MMHEEHLEAQFELAYDHARFFARQIADHAGTGKGYKDDSPRQVMLLCAVAGLILAYTDAYIDRCPEDEREGNEPDKVDKVCEAFRTLAHRREEWGRDKEGSE